MRIMAEKDLCHAQGNKTCQEMLSAMKPKNNLGSNKYCGQKKGPKLATKKSVQSGWNK
jgi:hypothetical protein